MGNLQQAVLKHLKLQPREYCRHSKGGSKENASGLFVDRVHFNPTFSQPLSFLDIRCYQLPTAKIFKAD